MYLFMDIFIIILIYFYQENISSERLPAGQHMYKFNI